MNQALVKDFRVAGAGHGVRFAPQMAQMLYFVAGEHSGDTRGAELIEFLRASRPDWQFRGLGGPKMRRLAGDGLVDWVEDAAVLGFWEVLKRYSWFKARFEETRREIEELRPDAVIFIDYPGFNMRLARALHEAAVPTRLISYISPQVWAWNKGRIQGIAERLDLMLCLFPFEKKIFESAGLPTVCMGHPIVDHLEDARIDCGREEDLVGLFPGSRRNEVSRLFPTMLEAVSHLHERFPRWRFKASAASSSLKGEMQSILDAYPGKQLPLVIEEGRSHELMQRARAGVVASGTTTLEASFYGLPYCLIYKVAWPTYLAGRLLVDIEYLGLANILAGRRIVHEFIQHEANVVNISAFLASVMTDQRRWRELERDLLEASAKLGTGGAAEIAAGAIVELLERKDGH